MKAVIPAAGEGKRFNKDSTYMHKCLVPINGKALLLYTLENLTNIKEITECIVIIGENHEKIIDTIGTKVNDTPILFCKQKQSVKGVVGAIESAVEEIGNDDFILVLADEFVYENNYAEAIEKFKTSTNECMVGLYYEKHLEYVKKNYTFIKSPDGFLYNFIEKPQIVYNNCSGTGKDMILIEKKQCEDLSYCNLLIFPWNKKTLLNYAIAEIYKENHQLTKLKLVIVKRDLNKCNIEELGFELELCIRRFNNSCRDIVSYAYMIQEC